MSRMKNMNMGMNLDGSVDIRQISERILAGGEITKAEAISLMDLEHEADLAALYGYANRIKSHFCGQQVDLCTIMNAKSGRCTEDCKFCAQSVYYKTHVETYGLVSTEQVMTLVAENEEAGVNRFSLVTSGRGIDEAEFKKVLEIYEHLQSHSKLDLCASLGIVALNELQALKSRGVSMYHHNLETSRTFYNQICTTHSYDERIETIQAAKQAGLKVCSGGIIGLGESREDRVSLAFELRNLGVESIPINVLNPIAGTPFENLQPLSQSEILKTVAVFRMVNPKAYIRLAGGRNLIKDNGKGCFLVGANATITGNYLTTSGNNIEEDHAMIQSLNLEVRQNG